jgi:Zn-dependent protease
MNNWRLGSWLFILFSKSVSLFKFIKVAKFGKVFLTFFSMCVSVFAYSFSLGVWFSVGFISLLFIHEMGHVIALRIKKIPTSPPVFIPFLGAAVFAPQLKSKQTEAFVGFGGPFLGMISCLLVLAVWKLAPEHNKIFLMLCYTAALVNIFNLMPIRPLDGGRITAVVGSWFKYIGIACLLACSLLIKQPFIFLIWILVIGEIGLGRRLTFYIGVLCEVAMAVFVALGFSDQGLAADVIDFILATFINAFYLFLVFNERAYIDHKKESSVTEDVPAAIRVRWLAFYLSLIASLVFLMIYLTPFLPKK